MPDAPSRELVLAKLHEAFPDPKQARQALDFLDLYGQQTWHRERERVQLGILKQCRGDLRRLCDLADLADKDFRDILVGAEFPEEFAAPFSTLATELANIRQRDREQYEAWLKSGPGLSKSTD